MKFFRKRPSLFYTALSETNALSQARLFCRDRSQRLALFLNRRIAQWPPKTKIGIITFFCLSMGVFSGDLLYRGLHSRPGPQGGFSTGPSISQPVTPLLSDSTLEAIRRLRALHSPHPSATSDSLTK